MKKVCVYGLPNFGILNSIALGLKNAGENVVWRRHDVFTLSCFEDMFDMVVVNGLRKQYKQILEVYSKNNIPVMVTDLGYIRKQPGYFQVGFNRLGWIPPFPCPDDRFQSLGIEVKERRLKNNKKVVICGQRPHDAAHNLGEEELVSYYSEQIDKIRQADKNIHITWRPHPDSIFDLKGVDKIERTGLFIDSVADYDAVVTYNSTTGITALLEGIPVFCSNSAYYAELCDTDTLNIHNPKPQDHDATLAFMARIAYSQWTIEEIESGKTLAFLLTILDRKNPFPEDTVFVTAKNKVTKKAVKRTKEKPNDEENASSNNIQQGRVQGVRQEIAGDLGQDLAE